MVVRAAIMTSLATASSALLAATPSSAASVSELVAASLLSSSALLLSETTQLSQHQQEPPSVIVEQSTTSTSLSDPTATMNQKPAFIRPALYQNQAPAFDTSLLATKAIDSFASPQLPSIAKPSLNTLAVPSPSRSLRAALGVLPDSAVENTVRGEPLALHRPKIIGHRGALYDALENTRPAFVRCAELGCDGVELDAFVLKDQSLVVFHGGGTDENPGLLEGLVLNPEYNEKSILDLTMEECQQLRFNSQNAEFPCSQEEVERGNIPLLKDVLLDLKGTGLQVKIELKGPGTVKPVLDLVESLDMVDQCCYSSFDHGMLRELRDLRPDTQRYPSGALFAGELPSDYLQRARDCGATEIHMRYDFCSRSTVQEIRQAGFQSMAWMRGPIGMTSDTQSRFLDVGSEDEACYQALFDTGVDQICLNKPAVAMPMVKRLESERLDLQQVELDGLMASSYDNLVATLPEVESTSA